MADIKQLTVADELVVKGNLKVTGEQIVTTTTDTQIKDRLITLNKGGTLGTDTAGIEVESGGSVTATLGYTAAAGWDFGNKNITTTGTISGIFNLALNSVDDTHIDFGTGANQVSTLDIPEQTNLYYTDARADARISNAVISALSNVHTATPTNGQVLVWDNSNLRWAPGNSGHTTTDTLSEGSTNLYYTDARARASISLGTAGPQAYNSSNGVLNIPDTTAHITEDASNKYYTDARADARIAAASINALSDVNTSGVANGNVLMYNGASFVAQAPALGVVNTQKSSTTSVNLSGMGTTFNDIATVPTFTITSNGKVEISYSSNIDVETAGGAKVGLFRSINGSGTWTPTPITTYNSNTQGFPLSFTFLDDLTGSSPAVTSVAYKIAVQFTSGSSNAYDLTNISFTATEFKIDVVDQITDLGDVTITSQQTGQIIYANSGTSWVNQTPTMSPVLTSSTNNILRYNGTSWEGVTPSAVAATMTLTGLGNVNSVTASDDGKLLKYDHSSGQFAWTAGIDVITEVVDDTTPQLGGDLDVQTHAIISTSGNNIVLTADGGSGAVQINGDLTVTGTATTLDVVNVEVEDSIMLLNKNSGATSTLDSGIMVDRGSSVNNAVWFWDHTDSRWTAATTVDGATSTNITETALADIEFATSHSTDNKAHYADLAEIYESDADYEPGTVLIFGGDKEVTQCKALQDSRVAGVVSTAPAYLMNKDGDGVAVALRGKVPCKVEGPVRKGDVLVTNVTPGTACTLTDDSPTPPGFCVIGKSLETSNDTGVRLINIVV